MSMTSISIFGTYDITLVSGNVVYNCVFSIGTQSWQLHGLWGMCNLYVVSFVLVDRIFRLVLGCYSLYVFSLVVAFGVFG